VSKALRVEASVASVASVVVVWPSAAVPAGSSTTLRFALPRMPLSVSWAVAAISHHYSARQIHWGYCVSV
jgi:hypothetical protein